MRYKSIRNPKHKQWLATIPVEEFEPPLRNRYVPTVYDDIPKPRYRSWKANRKVQYH